MSSLILRRFCSGATRERIKGLEAEIKTLTSALKRLKTRSKYPANPPKNAVNYYLEQRKKSANVAFGIGVNVKEAMAQLYKMSHAEWKVMSEAGKDKYRLKAEQMNEQFEERLREWKKANSLESEHVDKLETKIKESRKNLSQLKSDYQMSQIYSPTKRAETPKKK